MYTAEGVNPESCNRTQGKYMSMRFVMYDFFNELGILLGSNDFNSYKPEELETWIKLKLLVSQRNFVPLFFKCLADPVVSSLNITRPSVHVLAYVMDVDAKDTNKFNHKSLSQFCLTDTPTQTFCKIQYRKYASLHRTFPRDTGRRENVVSSIHKYKDFL